MDRSGKQKLVSEIQETLSDAQLVVIHPAKRPDCRRGHRPASQDAGGGCRLQSRQESAGTARALKGTKYEGLEKLLKGPTAIAFSSDPIAAAKVAVTFRQGNEKLKIVGGSMGADVLGPDAVKALATLPSLDELRGMLVGLLQTPATRVATILQAPPVSWLVSLAPMPIRAKPDFRPIPSTEEVQTR